MTDAGTKTTETVLDVRGLSVAFDTPDGVVNAVNDVSFSLKAGQCLGVVGESGSGKSQTFMAIMGAIARNGRTSGEAVYDGRNLLEMPRTELNQIRGDRITLVLQDALTSLTPHMRIGNQLTEGLIVHKGLSKADARARALEVLDLVRIPEAAHRMRSYPHELSGGMRQRITIALSLLCEPDILIADEPTTALDVTVQAQILDIFDDLRRDTDTAIVLITHDLGVIAGRADEVLVMYSGGVAELAPMQELFKTPYHPYTEGLLAAMPRFDGNTDQPMVAIPGQPPNLLSPPAGCSFSPRCPSVRERCRAERPNVGSFGETRRVACHFPRHDEPATQS